MTDTLDDSIETRIDECIAADSYLSVRAAATFRTVSMPWRGGYAKNYWRDLPSERRVAVVRQTVRLQLTSAGGVPTTEAKFIGWQAPCACLCGDFVAARGPRAVRAFLGGHAAARRRA